jgi:DNA polymerase III subunit gamma/tau
MSYQVLARKYRPQRFSDVIGQPHVTRTLKNAIEQKRIAHGYIFSGHRGIGKTTIARILAMALNCRSTDHPVAEPCGVCESCTEIRAGSAVDVIEIDAATNRGIDEIRELRDAARYRPARDRYKIYILDEAHQITDAAFNALLKTLEEPPSHIVFMMATTQPEDVPQTIRSRCQHFSFHAVKFDEIVAQLRDIAGREGITADDNALAMLAEAGDGSMRDALSIMDQAIACCGERLTGETVLQLVGSVPSETLEDMMGAVARGSSEEVLRLVDRLIVEGQSPIQFARQMVRFLRNAVVAKVAGGDSALLQISTDERARVARVAAQFAEEDLTRFLQILLRTHSELAYKQEQRFHLELGLLKMVHAGRLLPLEELLSQAAGIRSAAPRETAGPARPSGPPGATRSSVPTPSSDARSSRPSPFESDRARKSGVTPESSNPFRRDMSSGSASSALAMPSTDVVGTAARAIAVAEAPQPASEVVFVSKPSVSYSVASDENLTTAQNSTASSDAVTIDGLRGAVLAELETAGQNIVVTMLEEGEWSVAGGEVTVRIAKSAAMIDMAMGPDAKRISNAAASTALGRPAKIKVVSGTPANGGSAAVRTARTEAAGTARNRAAEDPVVQRVREKFGAEIRTVVDHKKL